MTGDLPDPLQPVLQRAAVNREQLRGGLQAAATLEVPAQGLDQNTVPPRVVVEQGGQPLLDKTFHFDRVRQFGEHPIDPELVKTTACPELFESSCILSAKVAWR